MKKTTQLLSVLAGAAILSASAATAADKFVLLPIFTDPDWKANIELAAVGGTMDFDNGSVKDDYNYGVEFSFDCPVFTLPGDNLLRQQLSLSRYDKNDVTITAIEMNPYYFIHFTKNLVLGIGPGIGAMYTEYPVTTTTGGLFPTTSTDTRNDWLFTLQAGAGLKYYMGSFLAGVDIRRTWTTENDFGGTKKYSLDNLRTLLKVGYRF